jgi:hypothetical protein
MTVQVRIPAPKFQGVNQADLLSLDSQLFTNAIHQFAESAFKQPHIGWLRHPIEIDRGYVQLRKNATRILAAQSRNYLLKPRILAMQLTKHSRPTNAAIPHPATEAHVIFAPTCRIRTPIATPNQTAEQPPAGLQGQSALKQFISALFLQSIDFTGFR